MVLLFNKICLQALLVLSVSLVSASAQVSAPVRVELTMVHLNELADLAGTGAGFVKAPKGGVVGVMSLAQAQALLTKTPGRDCLELGTVKLSSGQTTVVEKMHPVLVVPGIVVPEKRRHLERESPFCRMHLLLRSMKRPRLLAT